MQRLVYLIIILAVIIPQHSNGQSTNDSSAVRKVHVNSVWEHDDVASGDIAPLESQNFYLLWDVSVPMGGYIHEKDNSLSVALAKTQELVKNGILNSDYGRTTIQCMGIKDTIDPLEKCDDNQLRDRKFFSGLDSDIGLGIEFIIDSLKSGKMLGAALITDLMATTEYGTGATALLPYFKDEELLAYFTDGKIYMGILGVAPNYWGVKKGSCATESGPLGCWFNEGVQQWLPLNEVVKRPIYVLIMGRHLEGEDKHSNSVNTILDVVHGSLNDLGYNVKFERVTQGALGIQTNLTWHNPSITVKGRPPISLSSENGFSCHNRSDHTLSSEFEDHGILVDEIPVDVTDGLETFSQVGKHGKNGLKLDLDCGKVLEWIRKERRCSNSDTPCNCTSDSVFKPDLSKITARISYETEGDMNWGEWSSIQHSDSLTLYLADFIDGLHPNRFDVEISPAPPLDCSRAR